MFLKRLRRVIVAAAGLTAEVLLLCYRRFLSPLKRPCCKYYPSCSAYALEAVRKKGLLAGSLKAAGRLLRCNPFSRGGYDPVD